MKHRLHPTRAALTAALPLGLFSALLAPTLPALAQPSGADGYGPHMMWGGGGMAWFLGPVMMLAFLAAAVAVVVLVVRWLGGTGPHGHPSSPRQGHSARQILEERFARGEIDESEFHKRKQALEE